VASIARRLHAGARVAMAHVCVCFLYVCFICMPYMYALCQITVASIAKRLDAGEGKALGKKKVEAGNWKLVALDDGSAVATNDSQFIKTSKHREGEGEEEMLRGMGLELHFTALGQLMWIEPETQVCALAVLELEGWCRLIRPVPV